MTTIKYGKNMFFNILISYQQSFLFQQFLQMQDTRNLNYDNNRGYNNELRSMPDTQWGKVSRYGDQDSYNRRHKSDMYENEHMDRFQVYEIKIGNNFDETTQEKLKWFLKSFIQELNSFCVIIMRKF